MCAKTNLLWTGGWDSSFRLLQLLIIQKKEVQPYYVIDTQRKSIVMELNAMHAIRYHLKSSFPDAAARLSDTIYENKDDLEISTDIVNYFRLFADQYKIGTQYIWLAAFAKTYGIHDLELCIDKGPFENTWMEQVLARLTDLGDDCRLHAPLSADDKLNLFKDFKFPLLVIDKAGMEMVARENGFYDILIHCWFCLNPFLNKPCGVCRPCRLTREAKNNHGHKMPGPAMRRIIIWLRFLKVMALNVYSRKGRHQKLAPGEYSLQRESIDAETPEAIPNV